MPVDEIRSMFLRRIFQDFVGRLLAATIITVCFRLLSIVVPTFDTFHQTINLILVIMIFIVLIFSSLLKAGRDLAIAYKKWDVFQVRILNKISDSQGNLRITLDSPVFAYYTARDGDEKSKLEQQDIVTVVACGTRFIALY